MPGKPAQAVLSAGELQKIAELARLSLSKAELAEYESELEELFSMFASVSKFASEGGEPQAAAAAHKLRKDEPALEEKKAQRLRKVPGKTDEDGLYNAPRTKFD